MTLTPERIAELRRLHGRSGAPGIRGSASIRAIPELLDEIDRLRAVIRETHAPCAEWQASVYNPLRHAPTCKLYEIEP